ncbi:MAG: hypothetical protein QM426_08025 [Euryarchaeota archaeon]|nr:hypothetical protein [Euryarchaeota archaeon]
MKDMISITNKIQEVIGVFFGLILFYFWFIFIHNIKMLFFSEVSVVDGNEITKAQYWGQIDQWLVAGLLLFFLIFGHYLLCSKNMSTIKKNRDIIGMKSTLIGFILWLFVTMITFLFKITFPYSFNIAGGYLTIISTYFLLKNR